MQFPVTRNQLIVATGSFGFGPSDAQQIIEALEAQGRIELSGSMVHVKNPTDPDAQSLAGLCREARGGSSGAVGADKIREYLQLTLRDATKHGSSRRV